MPRNVSIRVHPDEIRQSQRFTDVFIPTVHHNTVGYVRRRGYRLRYVAHTWASATCEICAHRPARRLFFFYSASRNEWRMLGSECAREWLSPADFQHELRALDREIRSAARMNIGRAEELDEEEDDLDNLIRTSIAPQWQRDNRNVFVWLNNYVRPGTFSQREHTQTLALRRTVLAQGFLNPRDTRRARQLWLDADDDEDIDDEDDEDEEDEEEFDDDDEDDYDEEHDEWIRRYPALLAWLDAFDEDAWRSLGGAGYQTRNVRRYRDFLRSRALTPIETGWVCRRIQDVNRLSAVRLERALNNGPLDRDDPALVMMIRASVNAQATVEQFDQERRQRVQERRQQIQARRPSSRVSETRSARARPARVYETLPPQMSEVRGKVPQ